MVTMPTPPTTAATYHRAPPQSPFQAPPPAPSPTPLQGPPPLELERCTSPHEVTSFFFHSQTNNIFIFIFLLKDNFGILKLYGGARRNHGGAGRSCLACNKLN